MSERNLWQLLEGHNKIVSLKLNGVRIVEDQSSSATRKLVDFVAEHELLEKLIDNVKPKINDIGDRESFIGLHYLLFTPFRYPSLKHGSRFGTINERSLFYGALHIATAMAEKAFYIFAMFNGSDGNLDRAALSRSSFQFAINTKFGIDLCSSPFIKYRGEISSCTSYETSQLLGNEMRKNNIQAFVSYSARSKNDGKNINVFTPQAFESKKIIAKSLQHWNCYVSKESVEFSSSLQEKFVFNFNDFLVDGVFLFPSN